MSRSRGANFESLAGTLVHTMGAQWVYLERWQGRSPRSMPQAADFADLPAIQTRWTEIERATHAFVAALGDGDVARVVEYTNFQGERWAYPLWQQMMHQVNHATHTAQAAVIRTGPAVAGRPRPVYFVDVERARARRSERRVRQAPRAGGRVADGGAGEIVTLLGANGSGKSTTLRAVSGLVRPAPGDPLGRARRQRWPADAIVAAGVGHVPEGRDVFAEFRVLENLHAGAHTVARHEMPARLEAAYGMFPVLEQRRRQRAGTLSGGEQQMLAIARALMMRPRLLLLDEPSLGLAPLLVQEIFAVIRRINAEGVGVLLVEQNARAALGVAGRGYVLETGRVVAAGASAALAVDPRVRSAYLGLVPGEASAYDR